MLLLSGCVSTKMGPSALRKSQPAYSSEIASTKNEQILANIVRMRYLDKPCFMDVKSVEQSLSFSGSLGMNVEAKSGTETLFKPSLGTSLTQSPKVAFDPNYGDSFTRKFLTAVQEPILLSAIQSGWSVDRVFKLCVEKLNGLENASVASEPASTSIPRYKDFYRFTDLLSVLQDNYLFYIGKDPDNNFPSMLFRIKNDQGFAKEINELKTLASLDKNRTDYKIKGNFLSQNPKKMVFKFRSLHGILSLLSRAVAVPEKHLDLVPATLYADGTEFNWENLLNGLINIESSTAKPKDAFVSIKYRKHWFFIRDNDLDSKATMLFLNQLFDLQSCTLKTKKEKIAL